MPKIEKKHRWRNLREKKSLVTESNKNGTYHFHEDEFNELCTVQVSSVCKCMHAAVRSTSKDSIVVKEEEKEDKKLHKSGSVFSPPPLPLLLPPLFLFLLLLFTRG